MGSKKRPKTRGFDPDPFDEYDDYDEFDEFEEFDDDLNIGNDLAKDFYSTDWDDPSRSEKRFSTRRQIERRNDLKLLFSQIDDWNDLNLGNDW